MNQRLTFFLLLCLGCSQVSQARSLIVVEDRGGSSALPYYQDLAPEPTNQASSVQNLGVRVSGAFPVRSEHLSPGEAKGRVINAPGLQPFFLIGDDELSKAWLAQRLDQLQQLQAVGLVINVASAERFAEVRQWAQGLQVVPAPADDLAGRLGVQHYPLLITATAIQQ